MTTVNDMLQRFAAFDPIEAAGVAMLATPQALLDYNRKQLYERGIDKNEVPLGEYSRGTIATGYVAEKGNPRLSNGGGSFDLKHTGRTYDTLQLQVQGDSFDIVPQTPYALDHVTKDAYGLTEDSKADYWNTTLRGQVVDALALATGCTTA